MRKDSVVSVERTTSDMTEETTHSKDYDGVVPPEIFDIEDSDEMAEMYIEEFGVSEVFDFGL